MEWEICKHFSLSLILSLDLYAIVVIERCRFEGRKREAVSVWRCHTNATIMLRGKSPKKTKNNSAWQAVVIRGWISILVNRHLLRARASLILQAPFMMAELQARRNWHGHWRQISWERRPNSLRGGSTPWANSIAPCRGNVGNSILQDDEKWWKMSQDAEGRSEASCYICYITLHLTYISQHLSMWRCKVTLRTEVCALQTDTPTHTHPHRRMTVRFWVVVLGVSFVLILELPTHCHTWNREWDARLKYQHYFYHYVDKTNSIYFNTWPRLYICWSCQ